jgi:hypothetical protein
MTGTELKFVPGPGAPSCEDVHGQEGGTRMCSHSRGAKSTRDAAEDRALHAPHTSSGRCDDRCGNLTIPLIDSIRIRRSFINGPRAGPPRQQSQNGSLPSVPVEVGRFHAFGAPGTALATAPFLLVPFSWQPRIDRRAFYARASVPRPGCHRFGGPRSTTPNEQRTYPAFAFGLSGDPPSPTIANGR